MTPEMRDISLRAVACPKWRWMPGMLVADAIGKQRIYDDVAGEPYWSTDGWLPDLTDPATMGCLLALVREAWGLPRLGVAFDHDADEWIVRSWNATILWQGLGNSEADALVAALEAAPR